MATRKPAKSPTEKLVSGEVIRIDEKTFRKRGDVYIPEGDTDPELFDAVPDEADLIAPALQGVLAELGAADEASKVIVSRLESSGGIKKSVYLFEVHPTDFRIQDLQESYGPGDYSIKVFGLQAGTNYKVIHANKRISVGATPEQAREKKSQIVPQTDTARMLSESLAPILAAQNQLIAQIAKSGTAAPSRREMLEEMQLISAMFKTPPSDGLTGISGLQTVLSLLEKMKGESNLSDPEAAPYAVIQKALDVFGPMLAGRAAAAPAAALPAPRPAAPAAAQPAAPIGTANQEEEQMNLIQRAALAGQLAILVHAAKNDSDPDLYATLIYEQAPDEILDKLQSDKWFEELCALDPQFAPFRTWCEKVRGAVIAALNEPGGEEGDDLTDKPAAATVAANASESTTGPGTVKPA